MFANKRMKSSKDWSFCTNTRERQFQIHANISILLKVNRRRKVKKKNHMSKITPRSVAKSRTYKLKVAQHHPE